MRRSAPIMDAPPVDDYERFVVDSRQRLFRLAIVLCGDPVLAEDLVADILKSPRRAYLQSGTVSLWDGRYVVYLGQDARHRVLSDGQVLALARGLRIATITDETTWFDAGTALPG